VGKSYTLSFDGAAGQFRGFSGDSQDYWQVTFSDGTTTQTFDTATADVPSHGFSSGPLDGWYHVTTTFKATSTSEALSFNDVGCVFNDAGVCGNTPPTVPPFSLLDSVTMSVPEPSAWVMLALGFAGLGFAGLRGRKNPVSIV